MSALVAYNEFTAGTIALARVGPPLQWRTTGSTQAAADPSLRLCMHGRKKKKKEKKESLQNAIRFAGGKSHEAPC